MTAASEHPLAGEAPASPHGPHGRFRGTHFGHALIAVLLTLCCGSVGGPSVAVETGQGAGSIVPSALHEVSVPVASESSLRQGLAVIRRRFTRAAARLAPFDGVRRFAHWLLVQFRLMPAVWRAPTVLRL